MDFEIDLAAAFLAGAEESPDFRGGDFVDLDV
ncbi:MAG: hypothetical protein RLZ97_2705, partial [Verrucomicrobiota bacterium]